jgi:hypothetical protein
VSPLNQWNKGLDAQSSTPASPEGTAQDAVNLLLRAMHSGGEGHLKHSFTFGRPGAALWDRRLGAEVAYDPAAMMRAAVHVRQNGPAYLKTLSVQDVHSLLTEFVSENFWHLAEEVLFSQSRGAFHEIVSSRTRDVLAAAMVRSEIFQPREALTVFPLVSVIVEEDFVDYADLIPESPDRSLGRLAQQRLQLCEGVFDGLKSGLWVEGRAGWHRPLRWRAGLLVPCGC